MDMWTHLGRANNIIAELYSFKGQILMSQNLKINNLIVELDAQVVVHLIQSNSDWNFLLMPLLIDCRKILRDFQFQDLL